MLDKLQFSIDGHWAANDRGRVVTEGVDSIPFAAPPEFNGKAGFWSPEALLLASVGSCFITTFRAIAAYSKFEPLALDVHVEGTVSKNPSGYEFTEITLKPRLVIQEESDRGRACRLLEKTEHSCLVSRSLKCPVRMEAKVESPETTVTCGGLAVAAD
jgi:organic hydroperoxide reductase OsmC/OhrA